MSDEYEHNILSLPEARLYEVNDEDLDIEGRAVVYATSNDLSTFTVEFLEDEFHYADGNWISDERGRIMVSSDAQPRDYPVYPDEFGDWPDDNESDALFYILEGLRQRYIGDVISRFWYTVQVKTTHGWHTPMDTRDAWAYYGFHEAIDKLSSERAKLPEDKRDDLRIVAINIGVAASE